MSGLLRVQALVFDLDGTLLDTQEDLANSVNHALSAPATRSVPWRRSAP